MIGKIDRFPLRKVWPHEAHHFTTWLADNLDVLSECISLDLSLIEREAAAGDFSVDLLVEDSNGRTVIIENQLERTDHDHLGKLLTYLAAHDAEVAVWIASDPRPEHTKAVAWLNDSSPADFHLLRAEAVKIGNSPAALLLTPIVGPSAGSKIVAKQKQEKAERHELRHEFWTGLLEEAKKRTQLHANISPSQVNWIGASSGIAGCMYVYVVGQTWWRTELYIDRGRDLSTQNKHIFDAIAQKQREIESAFGQPLNWERLDDKQACRISFASDTGGYRSERELWPNIQSDMIDTMIRFEAAIRTSLQETARSL
ncbi:MAG: DUF4268 domain-containing protein [Phycisphaeraceae bacterium]|nr:DUF4268 domain-containing protein [Phycisphaeraceae bacterium]